MLTVATARLDDPGQPVHVCTSISLPGVPVQTCETRLYCAEYILWERAPGEEWYNAIVLPWPKKIETTVRTWHRRVISQACTRLCLACVAVPIFLARVVEKGEGRETQRAEEGGVEAQACKRYQAARYVHRGGTQRPPAVCACSVLPGISCTPPWIRASSSEWGQVHRTVAISTHNLRWQSEYSAAQRISHLDLHRLLWFACRSQDPTSEGSYPESCWQQLARDTRKSSSEDERRRREVRERERERERQRDRERDR